MYLAVTLINEKEAFVMNWPEKHTTNCLCIIAGDPNGYITFCWGIKKGTINFCKM